MLTPLGRKQMKSLGERMAKRLKLIRKIDPNQVEIYATNVTRTIDSANEYINGIFKRFSSKPVVNPIPSDEDFLLKFPDLCNRYLKVTHVNVFYRTIF